MRKQGFFGEAVAEEGPDRRRRTHGRRGLETAAADEDAARRKEGCRGLLDIGGGTTERVFSRYSTTGIRTSKAAHGERDGFHFPKSLGFDLPQRANLIPGVPRTTRSLLDPTFHWLEAFLVTSITPISSVCEISLPGRVKNRD